jgi:peptidoglycan/xylan/chitin deacetylase (PgdA/CDA1 family)
VNDVAPALFRRHLEVALEAGYRFVPAADLVDADPTDVDDRRLALTFDDGFRSMASNAVPVLKDLDIPWTLFVVTDWAEGRHEMGDVLLSWDEIERLAEGGATIASHSVTHADFSRLTPTAVAEELGRSREALRERLGIDTDEFAIPFGQSGNWNLATQAAAQDAGYRTVYAQSVDRRPIGTVARTFVTHYDQDAVFRAALAGAFDRWEEWV